MNRQSINKLIVKTYHQKRRIDFITPTERRDCEFQYIFAMHPPTTVMGMTGKYQSRI
jgi:hypothetical protein